MAKSRRSNNVKGFARITTGTNTISFFALKQSARLHRAPMTKATAKKANRSDADTGEAGNAIK